MAATAVHYGDEASLFASIPFELVSHEGPIDDVLRGRNVVFHRHAEVRAPKRLPLETLGWVGCRTHAERESLLHLLGAGRPKWETFVRVATD